MESEVKKNTSNSRAFSRSFVENSLSLKQWLQQQILWAITAYFRDMDETGMLDNVKFSLDEIPLRRLFDDTCILYQSAISLKLAPLLQLEAIALAHQLAAYFNLGAVDISLQVQFPGWLNFRLGDRSIAATLQQFLEMTPPSTVKGQPSPEREFELTPKAAAKIFELQYIHARCCSLLRLAAQRNLIQLAQTIEPNSPSYIIVRPHPIPWLDDEQQMSPALRQLRLRHLAERRLIAHLFDWHDRSTAAVQLDWLKHGTALSKAFEQFYSQCRIWGELEQTTPKLALARLGLVGITQTRLQSLLRDQLALPAPVEL